jgi:hypothetical protein
VALESSLHEVLLFEAPDVRQAIRLCERLSSGWCAWLRSDGTDQLVEVLLLDHDDADHNLAALLRTVEGWVEEQGLVAIRFTLDGRHYTLESGTAIWANMPAA